MNPLVYNKIISKLERLSEYYRILQELQKVNKNSFVNDYHFYNIAERNLQLSIEILLDVGKMIINAMNFEKAEDNQNVFDVLYNNKVISHKLHKFIWYGKFS